MIGAPVKRQCETEDLHVGERQPSTESLRDLCSEANAKRQSYSAIEWLENFPNMVVAG